MRSAAASGAAARDHRRGRPARAAADDGFLGGARAAILSRVFTLDVALGVSPARVRSALLQKDAARNSPAAKACFVTAPIAPPRLWQPVADAVGSAFERSLGDGQGGESAVQRALGAAAQAVAQVQSVLVEPALPLDAQFTAFVLAGEAALVTVSSGMRVYCARGGEPRRLLANVHRAQGLSRGGLAVAVERVKTGDLFVLGSRDAFGVRSMGALAALLARNVEAPVAAVCSAAIDPCRELGIGAALAVLRVR